MVMVFEVALVPVTHCEFETILHEIASPLTSDEELYVELVAPLIAVVALYH
jgi:3-methyladenine DNA glycosylase AlkD